MATEKEKLLRTFVEEIRDKAEEYLECFVNGSGTKATYLYQSVCEIAELAKRTVNNIEKEEDDDKDED